MPSDPPRHDEKLLRKLQARVPGAWRGVMVRGRLPHAVRQFLKEAEPAALERLLIETTHRLQSERSLPTLTDRAELHRLLQKELEMYRPATASSQKAKCEGQG